MNSRLRSLRGTESLWRKSMHRYVLKRLLLMIPVVLGVSLMIYCIMDLAPGDIISIKAGDDILSEEQEAALRAKYGLDKPLLIRYLYYMGNLVQGDLGTSYTYNEPVMKLYLQRLPHTIKLAFASLLVSFSLSIPLGIIAAVKHGSLIDNAAMVLALLGLSIPNFWLGLMLIIYFSNKWGIFPSGGDEAGIKSLVLPAITIGTGLMAALTRTTRSSMLDVIRKDYLRTARAKGALEKRVIFRHALKNAMIPILTILGSQLTSVLGGSVLTETVFTWPGVGRLVVDSINGRDVPTATGLLILKTIVMSFIVLIVDLLYAAVDPRVKARYSKGGKKKKA